MNFKSFNINTQFGLYISILEDILPLYTKFEVNWFISLEYADT